jgi:glycosyltransferase involved in cell wall biosynthesis
MVEAMCPKAIWITWETQVRNRSMAKALEVELFEFVYSGNRVIRYVLNVLKTMKVLIAERPRVVFSSNPSVVLALILLHLKVLLRYRYAVDAHFIGVMAFDKGHFFQRVLDYCNRRADMVIVTNEEHADHIRKIGGCPFVCEDPLPEFPEDASTIEEGLRGSILFICSFDPDEPYREVFDAAKFLLKDNLTVYVSGNFNKANIDPEEYPHVNFMGYAPPALFYSYVISVDLILDLTSAENCLVCGAYEAMTAEKPLVTSDTRALRSYFTHGAVYTTHEPERIADAIRSAYENRVGLEEEIRHWKTIAGKSLTRKIADLRDFIDE